jgi:hypothetical protein
VSQYEPEDPDPLLAFSAEAADAWAGPPAEPAAQPIVASAVPAFVSPPPIAHVSTERVERIEQSLEQSKRDIVLLTSQVTTLVGSIADIDKQLSRLRAPTVAQRARTSVQRVRVSTDVLRSLRTSADRLRSLRMSAKALFGSAADLRMSAAGLRNLMAFAALVVGLTIALATWRYWGGEAATAEPVAQAAQVTPPQAAAAPAVTMQSVTPPREALQLADAPLTPPPPKRVQYVGTLSIDATPWGEVFIDRKPAGRTPLRVPNLRAGSHLIWVERDGYRRWTRVVNVPADRISRVSAELEAIASR